VWGGIIKIGIKNYINGSSGDQSVAFDTFNDWNHRVHKQVTVTTTGTSATIYAQAVNLNINNPDAEGGVDNFALNCKGGDSAS
jgi:hypothetical protein